MSITPPRTEAISSSSCFFPSLEEIEKLVASRARKFFFGALLEPGRIGFGL